MESKKIEICCDCRKPMPKGNSGRCYRFGCSPLGFYDGDHHCEECATDCLSDDWTETEDFHLDEGPMN